MTVRFEDSLPVLARTICEQLGHDVLTQGVTLRDGRGRLTFFAAATLDPQTVERVSDSLRQQLGAYARDDRVLASSEEIGSDRFLNDPNFVIVYAGGYRVRLLDRRLVGADWLLPPAGPAAPPPRLVFASLTGGVGRSTALAVAAADLAARGQRVLAVDLDLEAPGLGPMLLDESAFPDFGTVDALVENGLSGLDDAFLSDLIRPSALPGGNGRVDVMPAFGRRTLRNPADALAKLARAYVDDVGQHGSISFRGQVEDLLQRFAGPDRYDAILVDARAGFNETSAASLLGIGAEVLLFGLDERRTFGSFAFLFTHLARFLRTDEAAAEWLSRLTLVQGKAPVDFEQRTGFAGRCHEIAFKAGLTPRRQLTLPAAAFGDLPWDNSILKGENGIATPVPVLEDRNYHGFDPIARRYLLSEKIYNVTFGSLLKKIWTGISPQASPYR